jgi:hypothetical protein
MEKQSIQRRGAENAEGCRERREKISLAFDALLRVSLRYFAFSALRLLQVQRGIRT